MQLDVDQLIKKLQAIQSKHGGGEMLVAAVERGHDREDTVLTGIVIVEEASVNDEGEVILHEAVA